MALLHSTSKKGGIVISYIALVFNTVSAILLTPILLKYLGVEEYGLYQMVYSVAHYILILDLGISTVMVRYISEFRARNDKRAEKNFAMIAGMVMAAIMVAVVLVGMAVNVNLENIYTHLTTRDYELSHRMFSFMIIQFVMTIANNYVKGVILAYERFVFSNVVNLAKLFLAFGLTVGFVCTGMGAIGIVWANTLVILLELLVNVFYVIKVLRFQVGFYSWDSVLVRGMFGLMGAMFLQSVVGHVNLMVDKTILGITCTKTDVAVYSIAATVVTLFNTIPSVMAGFFQPQTVKMVVNNASKTELTDLVIKVGRWQFVMVGAFLCGFALFGRDFITLWAGKEMLDAWLIVLIIMPFNMIPLVQTVCISILNAYDKRLDRSLILLGTTIVHIIFTIFLIKVMGPWGAPVGTAISYVLGYAVLMNVYYARVIHLEVRRMFSSIFRRTWVCLLLTSVVCLPLSHWEQVGIVPFVCKVVVFCCVFGGMLYCWGFSKTEKELVRSLLLKLRIHL